MHPDPSAATAEQTLRDLRRLQLLADPMPPARDQILKLIRTARPTA